MVKYRPLSAPGLPNYAIMLCADRHGNIEGHWGTNPGRDPRQAVSLTDNTTPLNIKHARRFERYWGTNPRPRAPAGSVMNNTTTQRTPCTNHNQDCTITIREPTLHPCTSYHTHIMHGEGVGTADSTTPTLDTKANNNNSYPSKDPEYYTQRSLTQQYITQRKPT